MKRLFRDKWDRKIAGVCGGLGHFVGIDPTIIRLIYILTCIFTGVLPLVVVYVVAWMLIPEGPSTYMEITGKKIYRSGKNRKISGICGGIAEALYVDPTIVRLVVLFAMVVTAFFPLIITYIIGTFIIPENPEEGR